MDEEWDAGITVDSCGDYVGFIENEGDALWLFRISLPKTGGCPPWNR
jgi:hypothetical protein